MGRVTGAAQAAVWWVGLAFRCEGAALLPGEEELGEIDAASDDLPGVELRYHR